MVDKKIIILYIKTATPQNTNPEEAGGLYSNYHWEYYTKKIMTYKTIGLEATPDLTYAAT